MPVRLEAATGNPRLNGVVITADERTGRALTIERLSLSAEQLERANFSALDAAQPTEPL
jgi:calcineurin-like phosphoesterase